MKIKVIEVYLIKKAGTDLILFCLFVLRCLA